MIKFPALKFNPVILKLTADCTTTRVSNQFISSRKHKHGTWVELEWECRKCYCWIFNSNDSKIYMQSAQTPLRSDLSKRLFRLLYSHCSTDTSGNLFSEFERPGKVAFPFTDFQCWHFFVFLMPWRFHRLKLSASQFEKVLKLHILCRWESGKSNRKTGKIGKSLFLFPFAISLANFDNTFSFFTFVFSAIKLLLNMVHVEWEWRQKLLPNFVEQRKRLCLSIFIVYRRFPLDASKCFIFNDSTSGIRVNSNNLKATSDELAHQFFVFLFHHYKLKLSSSRPRRASSSFSCVNELSEITEQNFLAFATLSCQAIKSNKMNYVGSEI